MAKRCWVLDCDNTLMECMHDYSGPILDAVREIIDALGSYAPHVSVITALENQIDVARQLETNPKTGTPFYNCKERFPGSLVATYEHLCQLAKVAPDPMVCKRLNAIGYDAFDGVRYNRNVTAGGVRLTHALRERGDTIVILTRGDTQIQERKLDAMRRCGVVCDQERIVEHDKAPSFEFVASVFRSVEGPDAVCYSVGDNYESDIEPALQYGYRGIWLPVEQWEQTGRIDSLKKRAMMAGVRIVQNLDELTDTLDTF